MRGNPQYSFWIPIAFAKILINTNRAKILRGDGIRGNTKTSQSPDLGDKGSNLATHCSTLPHTDQVNITQVRKKELRTGFRVQEFPEADYADVKVCQTES